MDRDNAASKGENDMKGFHDTSRVRPSRIAPGIAWIPEGREAARTAPDVDIHATISAPSARTPIGHHS